MTEKEQKAIEKLEELNWSYFDMSESSSIPYLQAIDTVLNLIQKQNKVIDLMANYIYATDYRSECGNTRNQVKEYFIKEAEEE